MTDDPYRGEQPYRREDPQRRPAAEGTGPAAAALRAALLRATRTAALLCLVAAVVTAGVAYAVVGLPGVWGTVVGYGLALAFLATTTLVGSRTAGGDPVRVAGAVLGSWLVKVVVVGVVLYLLRDATFYDPVALFAGIVVGMVITLWVEYRTLTAAQIPYVDTSGR